jgi:ABC-2 type transport system ATP-binding protein
MNNDIITVNNLVKAFGDFRAVDGISFSIQRGQIYGFLGANGAGKTTTIRILCGLLAPTSGQVSVAGVDIIKQSEAVKRSIGYMSQRFSLYEDLTVRENLKFYCGVYCLRSANVKKRMSEVSERLGIAKFADSLVRDLPVGWRQRLALASAILHQPEILFLDEPTSGVDPLARRAFWRLIYDLAAEGTTIIVTTHYMDEAEACQRIAIMHNGKIIAEGTIHELKTSRNAETLEEVFLAQVKSAMESKK